MKKIEVFNAFAYGIRTLGTHWYLLLKAFFTCLSVGILYLILVFATLSSFGLPLSVINQSGARELIQQLPMGVSVFIIIVTLLVGSFLTLGQIRLLLNIRDNNNPSISDLFSVYRTIPRFVWFGLVWMLVLGVASIALIVPAVIWFARTIFWGCIIVDRPDAWPLRKSIEITRGNTWRIIGFMLFSGLINYVPIIGYYISLLAQIDLYRQLSPRKRRVL